MRAWAVCVFLLAAFPAVAAQSAQTVADLHVAGQVHVQGFLDGSLDLRQLSVLPSGQGWTVELEASGATVLLRSQPEVQGRTDGEGQLGNTTHDYFLEDETRESFAFQGRIQFRPTQPNATVRFLNPERAVAWPWNATADFRIAPTSHREADGAFLPAYQDVRLMDSPAGGTFTLAHAGGVLDGPGWVVLQGGIATLEGTANRTVAVETRRTTLAAAPGLADASILQHDYLLVLAPRIALTFPEESRCLVLIDGLRGGFEGDLLLSDVVGNSSLDGRPVSQGSLLLQAIGDYRVSADYHGGAAAWRVEGQSEFFAVDTVALLDARVGVAIGGLGLLAVLALLLRVSHALGLLVGGRHRADPVSHGLRRNILALVQEQAPLTRQQVAAKLGVSKTVLDFHLGVLARCRLLQMQRVGLRLAIIPATGTPADNLEAALLRANPLRGFILQVVQAAGAATFQDVARRWRRHTGEGLSRSLFDYHATLLTQAGLLERTKEGKTVTWTTRKATASQAASQAVSQP